MQAEPGLRENEFLDRWTLPFGDWSSDVVEWVATDLDWVGDSMIWPFEKLFEHVIAGWFVDASWTTMCLLLLVFGIIGRGPIRGSFMVASLIVSSFLAVGIWPEMMESLGGLGLALVLSVGLGALLALPFQRKEDALPFFAVSRIQPYGLMVATVFLFGLGPAPAMFLTIAFSSRTVFVSRRSGVSMTVAARHALRVAGIVHVMASFMGAGGLPKILFRGIGSLDLEQAFASTLTYVAVLWVLDEFIQWTPTKFLAAVRVLLGRVGFGTRSSESEEPVDVTLGVI